MKKFKIKKYSSKKIKNFLAITNDEGAPVTKRDFLKVLLVTDLFKKLGSKATFTDYQNILKYVNKKCTKKRKKDLPDAKYEAEPSGTM